MTDSRLLRRQQEKGEKENPGKELLAAFASQVDF